MGILAKGFKNIIMLSGRVMNSLLKTLYMLINDAAQLLSSACLRATKVDVLKYCFCLKWNSSQNSFLVLEEWERVRTVSPVSVLSVSVSGA